MLSGSVGAPQVQEIDDESTSPNAANTFLSKKISYIINSHEASNIFYGNFFTLISIALSEFSLYKNNDDLSDKDLQDDTFLKDKQIGVGVALACSLTFALVWLVNFRRKNNRRIDINLADKKKEHAIKKIEGKYYDDLKNQLNPWYRRFKAWSFLGNSVGQAASEIIFLLMGIFLPNRLAESLKTPIKTALAAFFSLVLGSIGVMFFADGPDVRKESNRSLFHIGRDGWARYAKGGLPLGGAIGGAIGAIIGFFIPIPGGIVAGAALGTALGSILGFAIFAVGVPLINRLINRFSPSKPKKYDLVESKPPAMLEKNKIYIEWPTAVVSAKSYFRYTVITPSGKKITSTITYGKVIKDKETGLKTINYDLDIKLKPDLSDEKTKNNILKILTKRMHIAPVNMSDSKDRTKYMRSGVAFGMSLGAVIGLLIGLSLPALGIPLCVALGIGLFALGGAVFMGLLGPKIHYKINPQDQCYNSVDFGVATGVSVGQSSSNLANGIAKALHFSNFLEKLGFDKAAIKAVSDAITQFIGVLGGIIGGAYDAITGRKQHNYLRNELKKVPDGLKGDEKLLRKNEIAAKVDDEFESKKPSVTWSQRVGAFVTYGSFVGSVLGFAIGLIVGTFILPGVGSAMGATIGSMIGMGAGSIISGVVAGFFGQQIYEWYASSDNRVLNWFKKIKNSLFNRTAPNDSPPILSKSNGSEKNSSTSSTPERGDTSDEEARATLAAGSTADATVVTKNDRDKESGQTTVSSNPFSFEYSEAKDLTSDKSLHHDTYLREGRDGKVVAYF